MTFSSAPVHPLKDPHLEAVVPPIMLSGRLQNGTGDQRIVSLKTLRLRPFWYGPCCVHLRPNSIPLDRVVERHSGYRIIIYNPVTCKSPGSNTSACLFSFGRGPLSIIKWCRMPLPFPEGHRLHLLETQSLSCFVPYLGPFPCASTRNCHYITLVTAAMT